jgi:hypothetical protein
LTAFEQKYSSLEELTAQKSEIFISLAIIGIYTENNDYCEKDFKLLFIASSMVLTSLPDVYIYFCDSNIGVAHIEIRLLEYN